MFFLTLGPKNTKIVRIINDTTFPSIFGSLNLMMVLFYSFEFNLTLYGHLKDNNLQKTHFSGSEQFYWYLQLILYKFLDKTNNLETLIFKMVLK